MLVQPLPVVDILDVRFPAVVIAVGFLVLVAVVVAIASVPSTDQVDVCPVDSVRVACRNRMEQTISVPWDLSDPSRRCIV